MKEYLNVSKEVKEAIKENKPVVALESTIISHGMPYPKNVETALKVEEIISLNNDFSSEPLETCRVISLVTSSLVFFWTDWWTTTPSALVL